MNPPSTIQKASAAVLLSAAATLLPECELIAAKGPQPNICTRSCWGARAPACSISQMSALTRAIIHHTAGASDFNTTGLEDSKSKVRAIQNMHIDRGMCDVAYHFLVDKWGNIFEGRSGSMSSLPRGTHAGCGNVNTFGFNFMGYFHSPYNQDPPVAMRSAVYDVIAWRMPSEWSPYGDRTAYPGSLNGTAAPVETHRWVGANSGSGCASTACPGDIIINKYITGNFFGGEMRDGIHQRKNGTTAPTYPNQAHAVGDFDGDGKTDLAIRKVGWGDWVVAYGNGASAQLRDGDTQFDTRGNQAFFVGDFNGDGKSDIVWRKTGWGQWRINYGGNTTALIGEGGTDFAHGAQRYAVGDFNNDGRSDVAYRKTGWPEWRVTFGGGATGTLFDSNTQFDGSTPAQVHFVGDFNGDGKDDIAFRKNAWGTWHVGYGGGGYNSIGEGGTDFTADGQRHAVADFNGDGKTDLAYRKGLWVEWRVTFGGGATGTLRDGRSDFDGTGNNQIHFVGDMNGDGKKDIAWRKTGWGVWIINYGTGTSGQWGEGGTDFNVAGQAHVAGDFNRDGRTDLAYRKTGWPEWRVTYGDSAYSTLRDGATDFDASNSVIAIGDFNGDAGSDISYRKTGWPEWRVTFGTGATGVLRDNRTDFDGGQISFAGSGTNTDYVQYAHQP